MKRHPDADPRFTALRGLDMPTFEDVDARRFRLLLVMVVLVLAFVATFGVMTASGQVSWLASAALIPLVIGFCAYAVDQERRLRHMTTHLLGERVLVTALENRLRELATLLDAGRAMNAVLELSEVLHRILDNALELLGASDGSVMLVDGPDVLRAVCVRGNDAARDSVERVGEGIAGRVAATREPLLIEGEVPGSVREGRIPESAMSVPLVHRGILLGVLNVNAQPGRIFDEYDLRALSLFGEHAASAIANAHLYEAERANALALAHRAAHDPLTDLGNRDLFSDRLACALTDERRRPIAVLFIDLDDFKKINDTLGHTIGDDLLRMVADRLREGLRPGDLAARLGGDEFAVLIEAVGSPEEALRIGERLLIGLSGPIDLGERTVTVRASMGVAVGLPGAATADELLRNADLAMYIAKGEGKACARVFEPAMHTALVERLELESMLEVAVEQAQLDLRYQPVVSLQTGRVTGFEALVRWNHPTRGELPPAAFIPMAEETGLVVGIDRWVLLKACCQGRLWAKTYPSEDPLMVGVNLSARQLEESNVVDMVQLALEVSGLPPEHLIIEITESFLLENETLAIERLEALRDLGVRLAIDDFGTGYSSLSYLRKLPIDVMKIDRSFIDGLGRNDEATALVQAILRLARSLNLETIAEGVERPDQRAALADMQCDMAQGWHFARPLQTAEMEDLLRTRTAALPIVV